MGINSENVGNNTGYGREQSHNVDNLQKYFADR